MSKNVKKSVAFFERGSWHHRTKSLNDDNSIKYGKLGGFKTEEEAIESYYKNIQEFEKSRIIKNINNPNITLKDYLTYWFEKVYSPVVQPTTRMVTAYAIYNLIIPNISDEIKLKLVTTEYINSLLEIVNPICKSAANKSREVLHQAMQSAVLEELINDNPVANATKYLRNKKDIVIYTKSETKRFLKEAQKGNWYLEILYALFLGLRKGEILALKFSDIDFKNETVKIQRQVCVSTKLDENMEEVGFRILEYKLENRDPKTVNGFRCLKMPKVIVKELIKRKQLIDERKKENPNYIDNDLISPRENGSLRTQSSMNSHVDRICQRCGVRKITVHGLRHMFATALLEYGTSIVKISAILGHSSVNTTFNYYCEIMEDIEKIKDFMNENFLVKEN